MTVIPLALVALRRDRLRTGLSLMSLAVAVTSVITVVAWGSGARAVVEQQVISAGTNLIVVSAGNWTSNGVRLGMGSSSRLTEGARPGDPKRDSRRRVREPGPTWTRLRRCWRSSLRG